MEDQRKQQLVEQYEDLALALLMDDYANEEGERLLREFEAAQQDGDLPEIPAELDRKCRKLINDAFVHQERRTWLKQIGHFTAKAAVVVLVMLGLSTVTVLSVDAIRTPVLNFLMDHSGRYSTVIYDNRTPEEIQGENSVISQLENNLPKGYRVTSKEVSDSVSRVVCEDDNKSIIYIHAIKTDAGLNVDAEVTEYTEVDFSGYEAVFWEKNGYTLMWLDDKTQVVYTFFADGLDINTFWETAYVLSE